MPRSDDGYSLRLNTHGYIFNRSIRMCQVRNRFDFTLNTRAFNFPFLEFGQYPVKAETCKFCDPVNYFVHFKSQLPTQDPMSGNLHENFDEIS